MADDFKESFAHKPKETQGNLVCKTGTLLCIVVVILVVLVLVADFIWYNAQPDSTSAWTPELATLAVFLVGFVVGWIVREATRK